MLLSVALNEGDAFEMQEDPSAPIVKLTARNERSMYQTISNRPTDEQCENWPPNKNNCFGTKKEDKHGTGTADSACRKNNVERLLVVSLAVTLEKISGRAGYAATDEVSTLLHKDKFNL